MSNNLTTTPALSNLSTQYIKNAPISTASVQKKETETLKHERPVQKEKNVNKKKVLITAGAALAALAGVYVLAKKGKGKEKVQEAVQNTASEIVQNDKTKDAAREKTAETIENTLDKLNYEIKAPKIDDLPDKDFALGGGDFPFDTGYRKIEFDIRRDENTLKRYNEVRDIIEDTAKEIDDKTAEFMNGRHFTIYPDNSMPGRAIFQKRFFSMPENYQKGYCGEDPLLSKTARSEIVDLHLGFDIIGDEALRNGLKNKFTITDKDSEFLDECVTRLTSNPEAKPYGQNSIFHSHEFIRIGKAFREAMGVAAR